MIIVVAIKEDENHFLHRTHVANLAKMHCSSLMTLYLECTRSNIKGPHSWKD